MTLHPTRSAPLALLLATPMAGWAHPGHDTAPALGFFEALAHLLTQPDHLALGAGALTLGLLLLGLVRRQRHRSRALKP